ncbi:MAG: hypothetical protein KGH75_03175 [Rhodospirillales bacterium]|nr:hypothetical protein [Rhodospirillales bacterium]
MTELSKAITKASNLIVSAIEAQSPETDCKLFPRKLHELVANSISAQDSSLVTIVANEIAPKVNMAADILACAHGMYSVGDKTNALRMVLAAFNSPDCVDLMTSLSELNEEADPSDVEAVTARINKGEAYDRDIVDHDPDEILFGEDHEIPPTHTDPLSAHEDALVGNPAAAIDAIQDQDLNWPNSGAPYADWSTYDYLNQGVPPDSYMVLRDVLSSEYDRDSDNWQKVIAREETPLTWRRNVSEDGKRHFMHAQGPGGHKAFITSNKVGKPLTSTIVKNGQRVHESGHNTLDEAKAHAAKIMNHLHQRSIHASSVHVWKKVKSPNGEVYARLNTPSHKAFIMMTPQGEFKSEIYKDKKRLKAKLHQSFSDAKHHVESYVTKNIVESNDVLSYGGLMGAGGYLMDHEQDLGTDDYGGFSNLIDSGYGDNYAFPNDENEYDIAAAVPMQNVADITPGYGDNHRTNVSTDPATDAYWNPANWNLDADLPYRSDPFIMDFDDMAAVNPGMTDLNGIDNTAKGEPRNESDTGYLQQMYGLVPTLNPSQEVICRITKKIKDPKVIAAINIMASKNDKESTAKLMTFINTYCAKHNIV